MGQLLGLKFLGYQSHIKQQLLHSKKFAHAGTRIILSHYSLLLSLALCPPPLSTPSSVLPLKTL